MAKLTLDKLEDFINGQETLESFPLTDAGEFTAEEMFRHHAGGLHEQVAMWTEVHARFTEYVAFLTGAQPPFVNKEEETVLRTAATRLRQVLDFASTQVQSAHEASAILEELVEHAAATRADGPAAREAFKARILDFAEPRLAEYKRAAKVFEDLGGDSDDLSGILSESFREYLTATLFEM